MNIILTAFILYLFVVLGIGFYAVRRTKNLGDFALGGHKLGPWVIAFSERASGESAWIIIGLPGAALVAGMFELWTALGCVLGIMASWLFIAKPLRRMTGQYQALTLPELFSKRFNDQDGTIRLIASIIITFFFTFYVAAQFSGAGKVLNVTFDLSEIEGMFLGAFIIVFYTMIGGFTAVAWTDVIQGIIMIGTLVILPLVGIIQLLDVEHGAIFNTGTLFNGEMGVSALIGVIGGLSWGLGYLGQPHLVTRYMAINEEKNINMGRKIAFSWAIPGFFGSVLIGLVGYQMIQSGVLSYNGEILTSVSQLPDPEKLMPIMATNLLHPWIAGIFISGAIAAMMSTADSQLLVTTTVLTEDIIRKYFKKMVKKVQLLSIGRVFTLVIGIVAFLLALETKDLVFEMVSYAWSGLGASFGPALILTIWWKKTSRSGVIAGMITGSLSTILWANTDLQLLITERLASFILALFAVVIFSWLEYERTTQHY